MSKVLLLLSILIPLAGTITVFIWGRKNKETVSFVSAGFSGATLLVIVSLYVLFNKGFNLTVGFNAGMPFEVALKADPLGLLLSLIAATLGFFVAVYSIEYIKTNKGIFNSFLQLSIYGMLGVTLSQNLFTLLLFFELFSIASTVLIIHKMTPEAIRAGFQYLMISVVGTACMIVAAAIIFANTGSLDLMGNGIANISKGPSVLVFWLLIAGFAVKAGMFPAHIWLPESYPVAPSAAAALLSGAMAKAGAYGIIRVIYGVYGGVSLAGPFTSTILIVLAVITMIGGSLAAITQKDLKTMLAYSSVAQIGYVILGAALLNATALSGAVLHIFNHALMKGSLFLAAGAVIHKTGKRSLEDLKGIGRKMPLTMAIITLAAFSMIGVPPFVGFFSKWLLAVGAMDSVRAGVINLPGAYVIIGMIVLSGLLNAIYFGPIIINGWFGGKKKETVHDEHGHSEEERYVLQEPSWLMMSPMMFLGIMTLLLGIYIKYPLQLVNMVVKLYFRS